MAEAKVDDQERKLVEFAQRLSARKYKVCFQRDFYPCSDRWSVVGDAWMVTDKRLKFVTNIDVADYTFYNI